MASEIQALNPELTPLFHWGGFEHPMRRFRRITDVGFVDPGIIEGFEVTLKPTTTDTLLVSPGTAVVRGTSAQSGMYVVVSDEEIEIGPLAAGQAHTWVYLQIFDSEFDGSVDPGDDRVAIMTDTTTTVSGSILPLADIPTGTPPGLTDTIVSNGDRRRMAMSYVNSWCFDSDNDYSTGASWAAGFASTAGTANWTHSGNNSKVIWLDGYIWVPADTRMRFDVSFYWAVDGIVTDGTLITQLAAGSGTGMGDTSNRRIENSAGADQWGEHTFMRWHDLNGPQFHRIFLWTQVNGIQMDFANAYVSLTPTTRHIPIESAS